MGFQASVIFKICSCFLFFIIDFFEVTGLIFVIDNVASKYVCLGVGVHGSSCGSLFLQFGGRSNPTFLFGDGYLVFCVVFCCVFLSSLCWSCYVFFR